KAAPVGNAAIAAERAEGGAVGVEGEQRAIAVAVRSGRAGDEKRHRGCSVSPARDPKRRRGGDRSPHGGIESRSSGYASVREGMEMARLGAMEAFVRVIEAGSFSGAAKQLHVGQPAVSKTIAQLEDRLGVRLLLRSTHGLSPTEAGRTFYERAKRSIEEAEEAELAARGAAAALTGRLRISAPVTFARLQIVPRLPAFFAENPALEIDLVLEDRDVDSVAEGIDVALWIGPFADSALIARKIALCRRIVVGAPAYFDVMGI